jgi:hypothetical protein
MGLISAITNAAFYVPDLFTGTEQDKKKVNSDLYRPLGGAVARESRARALFGMKDFSQLKTGSYDQITEVLKQELDKASSNKKLPRRL